MIKEAGIDPKKSVRKILLIRPACKIREIIRYQSAIIQHSLAPLSPGTLQALRH